jgi:hypothetical protein
MRKQCTCESNADDGGKYQDPSLRSGMVFNPTSRIVPLICIIYLPWNTERWDALV